MKHECNAPKTPLLRPDCVIIELNFSHLRKIKATIPNIFGNNIQITICLKYAPK